MRSLLWTATVALSCVATQAYDVTWDDDKSIKEAAAKAAYGLVKFYTGNNTGDTPGNLPDPYNWWEAGAMFGTLIDYWWLTGDDSYNNITSQAMLHQAGTPGDYMPDNQTMTEGNDDQGFWAMAAMSAAEHNFPDPPDTHPGWLAQAQAVFNEYVSRWDSKHCNGGLRWQIFPWNIGYDYKNSISNGCFFNIATRLALYTGNDTYAGWAEKVYNWQSKIGLVTDDMRIYDGVTIGNGQDCSNIVRTQWSYNTGIFLYGAAVLYNLTESDTWKKRVDGMMSDIWNKFVNNNILYEQFCEEHKQCNQDQRSFKGYLARWMAATSQVAPYTNTNITKLLKSSAQAAAKVCDGSPTRGYEGPAGTACGFSWLADSFDDIVGVGPQMNAVSIFMYTLMDKAKAPVTYKTGGTSKGNPGGGDINSEKEVGKTKYKTITTADKAGAGILTLLIAAGVVGGTAFLVIEC
ncbi:DFG5 [Fusarium beomiforme]|uniref:Mannan endo-1,6-alpha-mannosidase n=1 Tax=Fusarium beomiforme TaxID=44412 RepID=A0A9P5AFX2_9HYPO|nr:DFG5 [Fusarium beomiforme]